HRENSLDKHLDRASDSATGPVDAAAIKHITFLANDREEPQGDEEEVITPKQEEDFPMKLARDFLLAVGNASREKMLKNSTPFLAERDRQEEKRIEDKLKALGVDWSEPLGMTADASLQPKAEVELKLVGSQNEIVGAGADVKVEATVKNIGNGSF